MAFQESFESRGAIHDFEMRNVQDSGGNVRHGMEHDYGECSLRARLKNNMILSSGR